MTVVIVVVLVLMCGFNAVSAQQPTTVDGIALPNDVELLDANAPAATGKLARPFHNGLGGYPVAASGATGYPVVLLDPLLVRDTFSNCVSGSCPR